MNENCYSSFDSIELNEYYNDDDNEELLNENLYKMSDITEGNFMINMYLKNDIDLNELSKNFKLDVQLKNKKDGSYIMQGDNIVERPWNVCDTATKVNRGRTYKPYGFISIIKSSNENLSEYTNIPPIIPKGAWCTMCGNEGPYVHRYDCPNPSLTSLNLTEDGLIICKDNIKSLYEYKDIVLKLLNDEKLDKDEIEILYFDENKTNISYSNIKKIPKKDQKNNFSGSIMISYGYKNINKNFRISVSNSRNVSINNYLYNQIDQLDNILDDLKERVNNTGDYQDFIINNKEITKFTSSIRLSHKSKDEITVDLKYVYNYFYPVKDDIILENNDIKKTYEFSDGKKMFLVSDKDNILYNYNITLHDSTGRISLKLNKYEIKDEDFVLDNIKLSLQITRGGFIEIILSWNDKDIISKINIKQQFKIINRYMNDLKSFLKYHFDNIYNLYPDFIKKIPKIIVDKKITNTVSGVIPYKKITNVPAGTKIQLYDHKNMKWSDIYGYVIKKLSNNKNNKNNDIYEIIINKEPIKLNIGNDMFDIIRVDSLPFIKYMENGDHIYSLEQWNKLKYEYNVIIGKPTKYKHYDFRPEKTGKERPYLGELPEPLSFYGLCNKNMYVDRIGEVGRVDNLYVPVCKKIKDDKLYNNEMIEFIFDGFTEDKKEKANIKEDNIHGIKICDKYSGIIKKDHLNIGKIIYFWDDEINEWNEGKIIEKKHVPGKGSDYNAYSYIIVETDDNRIIDIKGELLHPMHRESRNFKGLNHYIPNNDEKQKEILIDCAKKLNLVKNDININKVEEKEQRKILNELYNITNTKNIKDIIKNYYPFSKTYIKRLTKKPYISCIIPDLESVRCIMLINKDKQFLINEKNKVMKIDIDNNKDYHGLIIDGYCVNEDNTNKFYPIDLLYLNGKKVTNNYLDDSEKCRYNKLMNILDNLYSSLDLKIIKRKFIGPINKEESLLDFVSNYLKKNKNKKYIIIFICQQGDNSSLIWQEANKNISITLQVYEDDDKYKLGLDNKILIDSYPINKKDIKYDIDGNEVNIINLDNKYVKIKFDLKNNLINDSDPYKEIIYIPKKNNLLTKYIRPYDNTKRILWSLTSNISKEDYMNDNEWIFPLTTSYIKLTSGGDSREPLILN